MVLLQGLLRLGRELQRDPGLQLLLRAVVLAAFAMPWLAPVARGETAGNGMPRICFREDAAPFSYLDEAGRPTGYSLDICRRALAAMGVKEPETVAVTTEDRFEALQAGRCDLLCEATTVTMERRAKMEFSLITFLTGSVLLYPRDLLEQVEASEEEVKVGLLTKTTAFDRWREGALNGGETAQFTFEVKRDHEEAERALVSGDLHAYIADREIIGRMLDANPGLAETHRISRNPLSYEPYAIAMRMGDDRLRVRVDEVIADLFRSDEILALLDVHLPGRREDPLLVDLFRLQSLPE